MIVSVNISDSDMEQVLIDVSTQNKLSPEVYVNNIVKGWLESQLRGMYKTYFDKAALADLKLAVADYAKLKENNGN